MITFATAQALKDAGLPWAPAEHDFFVFPDHNLDDRVFVLAEMPASLAQIQGETVFTFQGAMEWALDYIVTTAAVWLPSETQLRQALEARLPGPRLSLNVGPEGCRLEVQTAAGPLAFTGASAEAAYAAALLHLLRRPP